MTLLPKREYIMLLLGDLIVFAAALWLTLFVRYQEVPTDELIGQHAIPFALLFALWVIVFFIAGLYGRHTRLFRDRLTSTVVSAQTVNIALAGLFFFFVPFFGIAPKTNLLLYLPISLILIFGWRLAIFPHLRNSRRMKGVLIASGDDIEELAAEVARDKHYPFTFDHAIDTALTPSHAVIQEACRVATQDGISFVVMDFADTRVSAALPIIYDAAFHKHRFVLVDAIDLYLGVFQRAPLTLMRYEWVLRHVSTSLVYDAVKRAVDIAAALVMGLVSLIAYPFVILAIKLDDGGPVFITQERVGRFQKPIRIIKFRSMSGNDEGRYGENGTTQLKVTRVGKWIRVLRIDELPQLWNVLTGDLSLVGPRPELPALASQYNARIPYYNARYLVAPGLTGWAQVKHDTAPRHGLDIEKMKDKLAYDLYYLKHRSLLLDIYIILQTIRVVLSARGT